MRQPKRTAISLAVAHLALFGAGAVHAQSSSAGETIVVTGQRQALESAQKRKQDAEEIIESVVAEEAGKLPDRSITEVLQRVVGVTVQRQRTINNDAAHFSEESSGIRVRGLGWGSSNLNGREIFSAGWPGKDLSWGAVPTELMAGVDVYKNPSAERIEGAVSGIVDLRTQLPFYFKGTKAYVSFGGSYEERSRKSSPALSGLYSTQWDAESGHWGVLVDLAKNKSTYASTQLQLNAYYPRTDLVKDRTVYIPSGANWGVNVGSSDRTGLYGALQWKKNDMESALTYFVSKSLDRDTGSNMYTGYDGNLNVSIYKTQVSNQVIDDNGVMVSGHYTYPGGKGLNNFADGGFSMGTSRSYNEHHTKTGELAWNFKWTVNDRWTVQNDLQWVRSDFETNGHEIQLATFMPSIDITTMGSQPVQLGFDQKTRDFLANSDNYFWNIIQPTRLKGVSNLYAWKADAKFRFEDPVLRDFRFGFRTSFRNSVRERANFLSDKNSAGWQSIATPWDVRQTSTPGQLPSVNDQPTWASRATFGYLKDPKYRYPTEVFQFSDFNNGKTGNLPAVVFPTYDLMRDYPNSYNDIMSNVRFQQCLDGANQRAADSKKPVDTSGCYTTDAKGNKVNRYLFDGTLVYGINPNMTSSANLRTNAIYGVLRFGFDDWKIPMEGNAGVRVVYTKTDSHGFVVFTPKYDDKTPPSLPRFGAVNEPINVEAAHYDTLPSLNLKFNLSGDEKLLGRVALSRGVYRPDFKQLQESISLSQSVDGVNNKVNYTGSNNGNANLKPLTVDNLDVSLEWYPQSGQSITVGAFYKDVKDIIYNGMYTRQYKDLAGTPQTFQITGPQNAAQGKVAGLEVGAGTYLDNLGFLKDRIPDWSKGFGVSANASVLNSSQTFYKDASTAYCPPNDSIVNASVKLYGCDTNGLPFGKLPIPGTTKYAANFALRYDRNGFSARLAYNWNSRSFQGLDEGWDGTSADPARQGKTDAWWGLPKWQEAYGQWDGGVSYQFSDKLSLSLNASNLNNVMVRETHQTHAGPTGVTWKFPGRSYYLSGRYEF